MFQASGWARRGAVACAVIVAGLAVPALAGAATASIQGDLIRITDADGADDDISVSPSGTNADGQVYRISGVQVGAGCEPGGGGALCADGRFRNNATGPVRAFSVDLAAGRDTLAFSVGTGNPPATIVMGDGDDEVTIDGPNGATVTGGTGADTIRLGGFGPSSGGPPTSGPAPGAVTVDAGPGADVIDAAARTSPDVIGGGGDADTLTYAGRPMTTPVTVRLDGLANDGDQRGSGEGDAVSSDLETIVGTPGADTIQGDGAPQTIDGGPGADAVDGGPGPGDVLSFASRNTSVTASLATGTTSDNDTVTGIEGLTGGGGGDQLTGDAGPNPLNGNGGADALRGGAGPDVLVGGPQNDLMDGGPGTDPDRFTGDAASDDTVDYTGRTEGVVLTLAEGATAAATLDGDTLVQVRSVTGGSGRDRLIGNSRANVLRGGPGNDRLDGRTGDDTLSGEADDDIIGPLRPTPFGICVIRFPGGRTCTIDFFVSNPAADGRDTVSGGTGNDLLSSVDGFADARLSCGAGDDGAQIDLLDPVPVLCERVQVGAFDQHPMARVLGAGQVGPGNRATVSVACPAPRRGGCAGVLELREDGRRVGAAAFRVRAGRAGPVQVGLPAALARRARRGTVTLTASTRGVDAAGRGLRTRSPLVLRG